MRLAGNLCYLIGYILLLLIQISNNWDIPVLPIKIAINSGDIGRATGRSWSELAMPVPFGSLNLRHEGWARKICVSKIIIKWTKLKSFNSLFWRGWRRWHIVILIFIYFIRFFFPDSYFPFSSSFFPQYINQYN